MTGIFKVSFAKSISSLYQRSGRTNSSEEQRKGPSSRSEGIHFTPRSSGSSDAPPPRPPRPIINLDIEPSIPTGRSSVESPSEAVPLNVNGPKPHTPRPQEAATQAKPPIPPRSTRRPQTVAVVKRDGCYFTDAPFEEAPLVDEETSRIQGTSDKSAIQRRYPSPPARPVRSTLRSASLSSAEFSKIVMKPQGSSDPSSTPAAREKRIRDLEYQILLLEKSIANIPITHATGGEMNLPKPPQPVPRNSSMIKPLALKSKSNNNLSYCSERSSSPEPTEYNTTSANPNPSFNPFPRGEKRPGSPLTPSFPKHSTNPPYSRPNTPSRPQVRVVLNGASRGHARSSSTVGNHNNSDSDTRQFKSDGPQTSASVVMSKRNGMLALRPDYRYNMQINAVNSTPISVHTARF